MSTDKERKRAVAHKRAVAVHEDAIDGVKKMFQLIEENPHEPWSDAIRESRDQIRERFTDILFNFPSSPLAQSVGDVWLNTSHAYLKSITAETNRAKHDLDMSQNHDSEYTYYAEQTLWKARTQYRNIVKEDVAFYKDLINRVVRFYNIQDLVEHTLGLIGIPVSHEPSEDGRLPADFTDVERQDTLHMVYEAVTHLGDLERYLSSLDNVELAPNGRPDPNAPFAERDYKSEDYYQTAITLDPDSGHAFNALANVHQSRQEQLKATYYFFRALCVRRPFRNLDETIRKLALKRIGRWTGPSKTGGRANVITNMYLIAIDMIHCQIRLEDAASLTSGASYHLPDALSMKHFPADDLVKLTICLIATHHRARSLATLTATSKKTPPGRDQLAKETALAALTVFFRTLCDVATWDLDHSDEPGHVSTHHDGQASTTRSGTHDPEDTADTEGLVPRLSSTLCRMLPTLRILSKWLKSHVGYLRRHMDRSKMGDVAGFWSKYTTCMIKIAETFPLHQLPSMMGSLEEDIEIIGFSPLARTSTHAQRFEAKDSDEEQLMRVSDLSIDAVLIIKQAVENNLVKPEVLERLQDLHRQPSDDSDEIDSDPAPGSSTKNQVDQGDKKKPATHSRDNSQDDDEEIVYTPSMAKASAQPKALARVASVARAKSGNATSAPALTSAEPVAGPSVTTTAESSTTAQARATVRPSQRAITAMDLVEQIGRRFAKPAPTPLEPPLPIDTPAGRVIGPPPGFSQPLVVKHAGPGPGFINRPAGHVPHPPVGRHLPSSHYIQRPEIVQNQPAKRYFEPRPGFEARPPVSLPTGPAPQSRKFPPHIPATQGLFGAAATMWTLSREESEEGIRRSLSQSSQTRDAHVQVPRVHSGSTLIGLDDLGLSHLSMSRSASQPSQSRPFPQNPHRTRDPLMWPTDYRDDLYLLAGRQLPIHY